MPLIVTDLYRYPVKSCRGQRLRAAPVEPWGLARDRRWMIVDSGGEVLTARERPRLVLITPVSEGDGIRLTEPAMPELTVPVPPPGELVPVAVWERKLLAPPAGPRAPGSARWPASRSGWSTSTTRRGGGRIRPTAGRATGSRSPTAFRCCSPARARCAS